MPEIPEIDVIIDGINKECINKYVDKVVVFDSRRVDPKVMQVIGKKLIDVFRYGKAIILRFDSLMLLWHLRLNGFVRVIDDISNPAKSWIMALVMGEDKLVLGDSRKLAEAKVIDKSYFHDVPDAAFIDESTFRELVSAPRYIKSILMDQSKILGLGNRYVDEVLWRTHIHPKKKGNTLKDDEIHKLFLNIKDVLQESYALGGDEHYTDVYGNPGNWTASVHGKKVCPVCGTPLKKVKIGGRTSYICPRCQPEP